MLAVERTAYLTIDDGPAGDFKQKVQLLNEKGIRAIWFCLGEALEKFSEEAVYAIKAGHVIGNRSYDQADFSAISLQEAREQISRTDQIINELYAAAEVARNVNYFRFPFMEREASVDHFTGIDQILEELGYSQPLFENITSEQGKEAGLEQGRHVTFTFDTFDLGEASAFSEESGVLQYAGNSIIKIHDWIALAPFQTLLNKLLSNGIGFQLPRGMDTALDSTLAYS